MNRSSQQENYRIRHLGKLVDIKMQSIRKGARTILDDMFKYTNPASNKKN